MIAIAAAVCAITIFLTTAYGCLFPQEGRR
jgi:hypothetical protein